MDKKIAAGSNYNARKTNLNPHSAMALQLREQAAELQKSADALLQQVKHARGTRDDITKRDNRGKGEYHLGNEGPTSELLETIKGMLDGKAWTFRELLDATGAGDNRIKGVLMRLQREGVNVVNVGSETRALWTIMTPAAFTRIKAAMEAAKRKKR